MMGICSVCQERIAVLRSSVPLAQEIARGEDAQDIERQYGEIIHYVVIDHDAWGERCDGSGQIPQTILG